MRYPSVGACVIPMSTYDVYVRNYPVLRAKKNTKKKNVTYNICEIEKFLETIICSLRGVLPSIGRKIRMYVLGGIK